MAIGGSQGEPLVLLYATASWLDDMLFFLIGRDGRLPDARLTEKRFIGKPVEHEFAIAQPSQAVGGFRGLSSYGSRLTDAVDESYPYRGLAPEGQVGPLDRKSVV